jgi:hypothetical protein
LRVAVRLAKLNKEVERRSRTSPSFQLPEILISTHDRSATTRPTLLNRLRTRAEKSAYLLGQAPRVPSFPTRFFARARHRRQRGGLAERSTPIAAAMPAPPASVPSTAPSGRSGRDQEVGTKALTRFCFCSSMPPSAQSPLGVTPFPIPKPEPNGLGKNWSRPRAGGTGVEVGTSLVS